MHHLKHTLLPALIAAALIPATARTSAADCADNNVLVLDSSDVTLALEDPQSTLDPSCFSLQLTASDANDDGGPLYGTDRLLRATLTNGCSTDALWFGEDPDAPSPLPFTPNQTRDITLAALSDLTLATELAPPDGASTRDVLYRYQRTLHLTLDDQNTTASVNAIVRDAFPPDPPPCNDTIEDEGCTIASPARPSSPDGLAWVLALGVLGFVSVRRRV